MISLVTDLLSQLHQRTSNVEKLIHLSTLAENNLRANKDDIVNAWYWKTAGTSFVLMPQSEIKDSLFEILLFFYQTGSKLSSIKATSTDAEQNARADPEQDTYSFTVHVTGEIELCFYVKKKSSTNLEEKIIRWKTEQFADGSFIHKDAKKALKITINSDRGHIQYEFLDKRPRDANVLNWENLQPPPTIP